MMNNVYCHTNYAYLYGVRKKRMTKNYKTFKNVIQKYIKGKANIVAETEVINVRLPKEVVEELDKIIQNKLFASRSEIIRHFLREYVQESKK